MLLYSGVPQEVRFCHPASINQLIVKSRKRKSFNVATETKRSSDVPQSIFWGPDMSVGLTRSKRYVVPKGMASGPLLL